MSRAQLYTNAQFNILTRKAREADFHRHRNNLDRARVKPGELGREKLKPKRYPHISKEAAIRRAAASPPRRERPTGMDAQSSLRRSQLGRPGSAAGARPGSAGMSRPGSATSLRPGSATSMRPSSAASGRSVGREVSNSRLNESVGSVDDRPPWDDNTRNATIPLKVGRTGSRPQSAAGRGGTPEPGAGGGSMRQRPASARPASAASNRSSGAGRSARGGGMADAGSMADGELYARLGPEQGRAFLDFVDLLASLDREALLSVAEASVRSALAKKKNLL